jgi:cell division septation protein DedD
VEAAPAASPPTAPAPAQQIVAAPVLAAASGAFRLQLAAFQDRAQADAVWRRLQRAHPAVLGDLRPQVVAADLGAKGTWYRLQAAGLGSEAAARAACELLKSHKQDCLVVKPG